MEDERYHMDNSLIGTRFSANIYNYASFSLYDINLCDFCMHVGPSYALVVHSMLRHDISRRFFIIT